MMPYVEVWVDEPEFGQKQLEAVADLVRAAKEVAGRQWPSDEAIMLERAAQRVAREVVLPGSRPEPTLFPADGKYRAWKAQRDGAGGAAAAENHMQGKA